MSKRIIAKICRFVIFGSATSVLSGGCSFVSSSTDQKPAVSSYEAPRVNGQIKSSDITESSGIAASKCQSNVLWTHNDSGDESFVFAINSSGESLGTWRVPNISNIDWEDIATFKAPNGKCYVYIGEIGDNKTKRQEHAVYRIPEPVVSTADASSSRKEPLNSTDAETLRFTYPDFIQDAETLMVHPKTGDIYVVTKRVSGPAGIYRLRPYFNRAEAQKAERIGELSVPAIPNGFLTGGDISPEGRRMIICDYTQAYEYVLPAGETDFDKIWNQMADSVNLGRRKGGEAVCYTADGLAIIATSEGKGSPVIEVRRKR